jgi:hypothetical protein
MCRTLEKAKNQDRLPEDSTAILLKMQIGYEESRSEGGVLNADEYIRRVAPSMSRWVPAIRMEGSSMFLYELNEAFKNLLSVYGHITGPILNSPSFPKRATH